MHAGFGQDRVNFFSSQEGVWLRPRHYSMPPYVDPRGQRKRLSLASEEKRSLLVRRKCAGEDLVLLWAFHVNCFFVLHLYY